MPAWTLALAALLDAKSWTKPPSRAAVGSMAALLAYACFKMWTTGWVFPLDDATVAIHEAGHPVVGILWGRLAVYGGTIFQLLFPALFCHHFARQDNPMGFSFGVLWLSTSAHAMARYMSDARVHGLPLVGGGGSEDAHDWTEIFSRWGLLKWDTAIGGGFCLLSWALALCCAWLLWSLWRAAPKDPPPFEAPPRPKA